jgi:demethylmenaquinone methyltransferase/2-methoxy-6-polyprenyl-1,4-benzoquinol methylase
VRDECTRINQKEEGMQDYYAARAGEYDQIYRKPERQADLRQMEAWLPGVFSGRSVLEIACGTGYWTPFYAPHATRVLGIDSAIEPLQIARTRMPRAVSAGAAADRRCLPATRARCQRPAFEAALAGFWWSHIPLERIPAFLQSLHAVLQPGARVVFMDNRYVPGSSTPIAERDAAGNSYQLRPLADGSVHRVLKNFPSREQLLATVAPGPTVANTTSGTTSGRWNTSCTAEARTVAAASPWLPFIIAPGELHAPEHHLHNMLPAIKSRMDRRRISKGHRPMPVSLRMPCGLC